MNVDGVEVPAHIIGDPAYPLRNWLMKGFTNHHVFTAKQKNFNYHLRSARMVVENAFGRLKGHWRCLVKQNDVDTAFMSTVVVACCILHNLCEDNGEIFLPEWECFDDENPVPDQPEVVRPQMNSH